MNATLVGFGVEKITIREREGEGLYVTYITLHCSDGSEVEISAHGSDELAVIECLPFKPFGQAEAAA